MENEAKLEIGYGLGKGDDAFAAGAEAARQALSSILEYALSLVLVFASVRYDLEELLRGVYSVVGEVPVVGASTSGEICNGPHSESVVVTILASPYLEVSVGFGEGVSQSWEQAVAQAVSTPALAPFFLPEDGTAWSNLTLQGKSAFALMFAPGETSTIWLRSFEILEGLKRLSQDRLPVIGGCAGDNLRMETNYVLWGRRAYQDSFLLVLCQTQLRFGIAMAHGLNPTAQRAMVTSVRDHEVLELDGQAAAEVYSRMQGHSRESLEGKHLTMVTGRPMGSLDPYGQYSINVATFFTPNGGLQMAQPVSEGTNLTVMTATPESVAAAGREALRKALLRGSITQAATVLVFSCCLRASFLGDRLSEEIQGMQQILPDVPITGFYSMGEQGLADDGVNRNNTEVIALLVLGRELSYAAQVALEREHLRGEMEQAEALKIAYAELKREVAERERAEKALWQSQQQLKSIFRAAPVGIGLVVKRVILEANETLCRMTGYAHEQLVGQNSRLLYPTEEDYEYVGSEKYRQITACGTGTVETRWKRQDGGIINLILCSTALDATDLSKGVIFTALDITERQRTEEALRRSEEQLRQSQKMEAIGRLAGGVAHDFNNILTAISGYSELLLLNLDTQDPLRQDATEIQQATERAASLTRQLLAFSRKQVIQPQLLNLNEVVANMDKMLRRLIREDIELQTILEPDLGAVTADPGQIEQVIINLVVNARDAMPQGGKLTLETANVELDEDYVQSHARAKAGPYVLLVVNDTGVGLSQEVQEHLFEPFFTTKRRGEGSGLGLSTVYGIVDQNGGFIEVYSEEGCGATFKIYLPRLDQPPDAAQAARVSTSEELGAETILLAEDEDLVRQVTSRMLAGNGYTVLEAGSGPEALQISQGHRAPIHLLLTDVVMPEMSGNKLAAALAPQRPEMKVLYMSGHTENAIVHHGVLEPGIAFIQKPFRRAALLQKVREVLGSTETRNYLNAK